MRRDLHASSGVRNRRREEYRLCHRPDFAQQAMIFVSPAAAKKAGAAAASIGREFPAIRVLGLAMEQATWAGEAAFGR
jgi:hypothetical protein